MQAHSQQQSPSYALLHKPCFAHGKAPAVASRSRESNLMKHKCAQSILLACETCLETNTKSTAVPITAAQCKNRLTIPKTAAVVWDSTEMMALQHTREKSNQMLHSQLCAQAEHTQSHTKHSRTQQCQTCNSIIPLAAAKL